jgi:subtilisin family serine protease
MGNHGQRQERDDVGERGAPNLAPTSRTQLPDRATDPHSLRPATAVPPVPDPMAIRTPILASLAALAVCSASTFGGTPGAPLIPGQATVRVVDQAHLQQCIASLGKQFRSVAVIDSVPGHEIYLLSYALTARQDADQVNAALVALQANSTILWGELNYGAQTAEGKTDSLWVSQLTIGAEQFTQQYAWNIIQLPVAHTRSTGLGTRIAILDTGIDASHPLLAGRVSPTSLSLVGKLPATVEVSDGVDADGDGNASEMLGHGTFMAGLITGIAPDATLYSVRVLDDDGYGDLFKITKGAYWAIDQGVDVINLSLGSTYNGHGLEDAATDAENLGIMLVAAAGNENHEKPREYPACNNHVVGVAATDWLDIKAPFSNYNDRLLLSAPGDSLSLGNGEADPSKSIISIVPGGGYAWWEGTSASTAMVSATAALIRAQHPEWPNAATAIDKIVGEILTTIESTSAPLDGDNPAYQGLLGVGRIDAGAAALLGPIQPPVGDLDFDGQVGSSDLSILLGAWGACPDCRADINSDGMVDAGDLAALLGHWG